MGLVALKIRFSKIEEKRGVFFISTDSIDRTELNANAYLSLLRVSYTQ